MEELISIAEYARQRGCTIQAVYKRLNTTLKPYVETVDGKKMLKMSVFEVSNSTVDKPYNNSVTTVEEDGSIADSLLRLLEEQLKAKDLEIERLHKEVEAARQEAAAAAQHNREQAKQLADLLEQSLQLQENNQWLQHNQQMLEAKAATVESEEAAVVNAAAAEQKIPWYKRIFVLNEKEK